MKSDINQAVRMTSLEVVERLTQDKVKGKGLVKKVVSRNKETIVANNTDLEDSKISYKDSSQKDSSLLSSGYKKKPARLNTAKKSNMVVSPSMPSKAIGEPSEQNNLSLRDLSFGKNNTPQLMQVVKKPLLNQHSHRRLKSSDFEPPSPCFAALELKDN
jgi:hypothetical protein